MRVFVCIATVSFLISIPLGKQPIIAQTQAQSGISTSSSSLLAVSLAQQAIRAMNNGAPVIDITISGSAVSPDANRLKAGTVSLKALGPLRSSMEISWSDGTAYSQIRSIDGLSMPVGSWSTDPNKTNAMSQFNCWTDTAWFFPLLSSLSQSGNKAFVFNYVGQEQLNGAMVEHIRSYRHLGGADATTQANVQRLSTIDYWLNAQTLLPVVLSYNDHPDHDGNTNVPIRVEFSNYQQVDGIQVPFHIQKLMNGGLTLDITVESAKVNSGLSNDAFTVQ